MKVRITRNSGPLEEYMARLRRSGFKEIPVLGNSGISIGYDMARL